MMKAELNAKTQRREDARDVGGLASLRPGDFALPEGFRDTPLGPLPETWEVTSLGEIATLRQETVDPQNISGLIYVGLEHIDTADTRLKRQGDPSQVISAKSRFYPGDVLYGKLRPYLDKAVLVESQGMCSTDILVLTATKKATSDFLAYLLHTQAVLNHAIATTTGVNHPRTSWRALGRLDVFLPSLPEQRAIAYALRAVQEAREATERVIAAARELKRALMRHLFTYGPVPVAQADQVELRETEIGAMPVHWEMVTLGDVLREDIKNGAFVKREQLGKGVPFLNVADTYKNISASHCDWQRAEARKQELETYSVQPGDLFFVRSSLKREGVGQCCIVEKIDATAIYDCHLMRVRVKETMAFPKFLAYYSVSAQGKSSLIARSKTTTMTTINQQGLSGFEFPLPSLAEQHAIARILTTVDAKIAAEEARRGALEALLHTLLHHLMTGKIRTQGRQDARTQRKI